MKNIKYPDYIIYLFITIVGGFLFTSFLGGVHLFDWDEINFAESAREMIVSKDYLTVQINFTPFWEKPPLFIWMQVASMKIFGINEFAARFPNAVCGIVTLILLYNIGKKYFSKDFGLIWAMAYVGSVLPFLYFKSGIIDPWFNLFIFLSIYQFNEFLSMSGNRWRQIILSGTFIGLAILTKGPVALLVFGIVIFVFFLFKKFKVTVKLTEIFVFSLTVAFVGGIWFLLLIIKGQYDVIQKFISYQITLFSTPDSGHGGFLLYHFVILFFGVFPASIIALPELFRFKRKNNNIGDLPLLMKILFWVVLILFTIVKTKIVHYSSLCYFPLTFIAATTIYNIYKGEWKIKPYVYWSLVVVSVLYLIIAIILPLFDTIKPYITSNFKIDPFSLACINANGEWKGLEGSAAIILLSGLIIFMLSVKKAQFFKGIVAIFLGTGVFVYLAMLLIVPRVERYSQHAAMEYLKSVSKEDAYIIPLGYKTYAHYFYGNSKFTFPTEPAAREKLLTEKSNKKVYVIMKIDDKEEKLKNFPRLKVLDEKNGFVFCVKE
jgi:4-amino-4-deoxy-L-arabinose transferase-like glycosyltransferase